VHETGQNMDVAVARRGYILSLISQVTYSKASTLSECSWQVEAGGLEVVSLHHKVSVRYPIGR
jgi:hypothetical protein